jgi:serine/threonine protein kinase
LKLGRYEIVRELGKGAMGIVYLAKDPLIGRLVALKTIRPAQHADDDETKEFQQRFIREAQAAGILNHPSIVTVFDIGQDDASQMNFIAMEYVEGQNLKEVLAQGKTLHFDQIAELIAQVAEALDFAHSKGIVHRDVKPANIILLEGQRAKIMDFGIAKIASGVANLTTTGQFLGTPNYMAPEQIKGSPVDGRTDIFSLGICLYESLTRRKPFGGESLTSISYKIVHEPFPPLHEINPQIPDGFEEVVANCLAKEPAKRYQRGRDVANALRAVVRGEKPRSGEPLLSEETVTNRDRSNLPTIEMPLPDLAASDDGRVAAARTAPGGPASAISRQFRQTVSNVRAYPLWRRPVPAPIAATIVGLLILALLWPVIAIRQRTLPDARWDELSYQRRQKERQLRTEGNELLRQGRTADAYTKFEQLGKLAPNSPAVNVMLQKLAAIRYQEEVGRQQIAVARQKLEAGVTLYNQRKYAEAVPLLDEAFNLNPTDAQAANYLRLAQLEEQKQITAKLAAQARTVRPPAPTPSSTSATGGDGGRPLPAAAPARVTTFFNSPFNDGVITVRVGGELLVNEPLWEEKGRFIRRKTPRVVNVTRELKSGLNDVFVSVVVPLQRINTQETRRFNFQPGAAHRLQITFNPQSKTFDYQLN